MLNNNSPKDLGVINTEPRSIRSDEWLVTTQMTVAQYSVGYPKVNKNIGEGQDMAVLLDVPYKDWSAVFKPQNLIFLIAPLNFAFAFKWWFLGGFLTVSAYFFFLRLMPRRRFEATLFGTILFFSPFIQWWYVSGTIISIGSGLALLTLLLLIHGTKDVKRQLLASVGFCYFAVVFALILYPPFQIPIFLMVMTTYLLFLVFKFFQEKNRRKELIRVVGIVGGASIVALLAVGVFVIQNHSTINIVSNTAYPGKRIVTPGDFPLLHPFASHLSTFLQNNDSVKRYRELYPLSSNQSESSNFLLPTVLIVALSILFLIRIKNIDKISQTILLGGVSLLILFFCNIYLPIGSTFYNLIGLGMVPHNRLLIGVGFILFVLLACLYKIMADGKTRLKLSNPILWSTFGIVAAGYLIWTYILSVRNPGFITNNVLAYSLALLIPLWLLAFLKNRLRLSLFFLLVLSIVSTGHVNPIERNLDEITDTSFAKTVRSVSKSDPSARWVSTDVTFENYAIANGAKSLSGVYAYPQKDIWKKLDRSGKDDFVYNRYAHVNFTFDDNREKPTFNLVGGDSYIVKISPCNNFFDEFNVVYFYGSSPISSRCLHPIAQLTNARATIYIYRRGLP